jgi:hypothetical protein
MRPAISDPEVNDAPFVLIVPLLYSLPLTIFVRVLPAARRKPHRLITIVCTPPRAPACAYALACDTTVIVAAVEFVIALYFLISIILTLPP